MRSLYPEEKRFAMKERMEGTKEGGGLIVIALSEKHETCNCRCTGAGDDLRYDWVHVLRRGRKGYSERERTRRRRGHVYPSFPHSENNVLSRQKNIKSDVRDGWTTTWETERGRKEALLSSRWTRYHYATKNAPSDLRKVSSTTADINFTIYRR